jgi:hypothetical protein
MKKVNPSAPKVKQIIVKGIHFQIMTGVPIPERGNKGGKWQTLLSNMAVNSCVVVKNHTDAGGLTSAAVRLNMKLTTRKDEGGVKVWRTK